MQPDPTGFIELMRMYRRELGYGAAAAIMAACKHLRQGDHWFVAFMSAIMAGLLGVCADALLTMLGLKPETGGLFLACVIGFLGVDTIFAMVLPDRLRGKSGDKPNV
ncbi:hypothetical protein BEE12_16020 [Pantoea agglomerans]|uniref:phage holin family protein n=1 Tax=Enterobacter agglomerans TaxID=549 RepID=UPI00083E43A9|nr:phage holin family protein [Pantoea agglomerans]AOE41225.1 hypothetical protein BEE12_16020 [Pantoea agglomerans]